MTTMKRPQANSRREAWLNHQGVLLEYLGWTIPKKPGPKTKLFYKNLNGPKKWFLFAEDIYPNRSEILVSRLDGKKIIIKIPIYENFPKQNVFEPEYDLYLISEKYPEDRKIQTDYIQDFVERATKEREEFIETVKNREAPGVPIPRPFSIEEFWKKYYA